MRNCLSLRYLICFVRYRKPNNEKKKIENGQKSEMKNASQLYASLFEGMQEYTLICIQ